MAPKAFAVVAGFGTAIPLADGHGDASRSGSRLQAQRDSRAQGRAYKRPGGRSDLAHDGRQGSNAPGKSLKGLGVTIALDAKTKVRRQGAKTIESLASDDRANVQLRRCKADLPLSPDSVDDVTAVRITAQAPASP